MSTIDYCNRLNNHFQGLRQPYAVSWEETSSGEPHSLEWTVVCKVYGDAKGTATDPTKAAAKQAAAQRALQTLGIAV